MLVITARLLSCGKVMFLQVSVILFTGKECLVLGGGAWSQGGSGPGGCLVRGVPGGDPLPDGYCYGRYVSYWNAFLLVIIIGTTTQSSFNFLSLSASTVTKFSRIENNGIKFQLVSNNTYSDTKFLSNTWKLPLPF